MKKTLVLATAMMLALGVSQAEATSCGCKPKTVAHKKVVKRSNVRVITKVEKVYVPVEIEKPVERVVEKIVEKPVIVEKRIVVEKPVDRYIYADRQSDRYSYSDQSQYSQYDDRYRYYNRDSYNQYQYDDKSRYSYQYDSRSYDSRYDSRGYYRYEWDGRGKNGSWMGPQPWTGNGWDNKFYPENSPYNPRFYEQECTTYCKGRP